MYKMNIGLFLATRRFDPKIAQVLENIDQYFAQPNFWAIFPREELPNVLKYRPSGHTVSHHLAVTRLFF